MECNKDEAIRAKEIAEKKFAAKDVLGARKFALKAQSLFPGLEGISQILTTLNVYISATNEINGKVILDWYGILGVDPLANDDTVRKQYRKLVHMLHPDNNKSISADWAFKLVSEAWNILSNKAIRLAYDKMIEARTDAEEIRKKPSQIKKDSNDKTTVKEISGNDHQKANKEGGKSVTNSDGRMNGFEAMNLFAGIATNNDMKNMLLIDAPDPHFYCFNLDRLKGSFGENQVWAAFDEEEGMPRYYAMVHNVISINPFMMHFSWLNIKKTKGERTFLINQGASRFSRACGNFEIGIYDITDTSVFFSHKVRCKIGNDGSIFIYPRKGDVWALYRNWSSNWNTLTPDEVTQKYDMVEVLDVFNDFIVLPLVKVAGFRTIFRRDLDLRKIRVIPRKEILRFSHQVPSTILSGEKAPDAPKGYRELDPTAISSEQFQVIEVVKDKDMVMVNNEDTIIKETTGDSMKEADSEEMNNDSGTHGDGKKKVLKL